MTKQQKARAHLARAQELLNDQDNLSFGVVGPMRRMRSSRRKYKSASFWENAKYMLKAKTKFGGKVIREILFEVLGTVPRQVNVKGSDRTYFESCIKIRIAKIRVWDGEGDRAPIPEEFNSKIGKTATVRRWKEHDTERYEKWRLLKKTDEEILKKLYSKRAVITQDSDNENLMYENHWIIYISYDDLVKIANERESEEREREEREREERERQERERQYQRDYDHLNEDDNWYGVLG